MKNFNGRIIILILWACLYSVIVQNNNHIFAQNTEKPNSKFAIWFGVRVYNQPPLGSSDKIDFFDYYLSEDWDNTNYKAGYEYLGISYFNKWNKNFETDLRVTVDPSFSPNTLFARASYYPHKLLGVALTYNACPQLLNQYDAYFQQSPIYQNMSARIISEQYPQWNIYDQSISIGAISPLNVGSLHLKLGLHAGLMFVSPFKTSILLSDNNSNYKAIHTYRFTPSAAAFINPEAVLEIDIHEFNGKAFGLQLQTSWIWTQRSINYKQTMYEWTTVSPVTQKVIAPKHDFEKFEFDAGLFYKW